MSSGCCSVGCDVDFGSAVELVDEPAELFETLKYVVTVETIAASVDRVSIGSVEVVIAAEMQNVSSLTHWPN